MSEITCFKAYDLRGRIPTELNDDVAYRVGRAYAEFLKPRRVVVGRDIRLSSAGLVEALCRGLDGRRRRCFRHRRLRHRGRVFRDLPRRIRRRDHGHRQPQPARLQRHEIRARTNRDRSARTMALRTSAASRSAPLFRPAAPARRAASARFDAGIFRTSSPISNRASSSRSRSSSMRATAARDSSSISSSRICRSNSSRSTMSRTAAFRTAFQTPCSGESGIHRRCDSREWRGSRHRVGRGLRSLLFLRRARRIHRGLLHRGAAGLGTAAGRRPAASRARSAIDVEYARDGRGGRRPRGAVQIRPCIHQAAHARGRRRLRRGDERPPLLPPVRLLRQRHDSVAAGGADRLRIRASRCPRLVGERMRRFPVSGELNYRVPDAARRDGGRRIPLRAARRWRCDRTDGVSFEFRDWRFNLRSSNTEPLIRLNVEARGSEELMRGEDPGTARGAEVAGRRGRGSLIGVSGWPPCCPNSQRRHPRVQRGAGAAHPVRTPVSVTRQAGHCLRVCVRQRRQQGPLGRAVARSSFSADLTKRGWCCFTPTSASTRRSWPGFAYARGDYVVTLDADLQNPPEEIGKLVEKLDEGYDYVGTIRQQRQDSLVAPLALEGRSTSCASGSRRCGSPTRAA